MPPQKSRQRNEILKFMFTLAWLKHELEKLQRKGVLLSDLYKDLRKMRSQSKTRNWSTNPNPFLPLLLKEITTTFLSNPLSTNCTFFITIKDFFQLLLFGFVWSSSSDVSFEFFDLAFEIGFLFRKTLQGTQKWAGILSLRAPWQQPGLWGAEAGEGSGILTWILAVYFSEVFLMSRMSCCSFLMASSSWDFSSSHCMALLESLCSWDSILLIYTKWEDCLLVSPRQNQPGLIPVLNSS